LSALSATMFRHRRPNVPASPTQSVAVMGIEHGPDGEGVMDTRSAPQRFARFHQQGRRMNKVGRRAEDDAEAPGRAFAVENDQFDAWWAL
jgi:hypothetical protein